jgi:NAD(P)H-dependent FMN reductase
MTDPTLQIIIASTRPGRVGPSIASWFERHAVAHGGFQVEVVDLAEVSLPLFDEPAHPMLQKYTHQHTRDWAATISRADAFVLVMPEYNHSFNAALKNALDYLNKEWAHKPVAFVSYGGIAAGTRAVQALKPVVSALKMLPLNEAVTIPFVATLLDEQKVLQPTEIMETSAKVLLDELLRVTGALRTLRS